MSLEKLLAGTMRTRRRLRCEQALDRTESLGLGPDVWNIGFSSAIVSVRKQDIYKDGIRLLQGFGMSGMPRVVSDHFGVQ